jgi:hypothetical protein
MCAVYYAAKHEYMLEKDLEMKEGARAAAAKHAAAKGGGERTARATMRKIRTRYGCRRNTRWRL